MCVAWPDSMSIQTRAGLAFYTQNGGTQHLVDNAGVYFCRRLSGIARETYAQTSSVFPSIHPIGEPIGEHFPAAAAAEVQVQMQVQPQPQPCLLGVEGAGEAEQAPR